MRGPNAIYASEAIALRRALSAKEELIAELDQQCKGALAEIRDRNERIAQLEKENAELKSRLEYWRELGETQ